MLVVLLARSQWGARNLAWWLVFNPEEAVLFPPSFEGV